MHINANKLIVTFWNWKLYVFSKIMVKSKSKKKYKLLNRTLAYNQIQKPLRIAKKLKNHFLKYS